MSDLSYANAFLGAHRLGPWTVTGKPDPTSTTSNAAATTRCSTDPTLLTRFRRRFPSRSDTHYDEMVRLLGYVWDCPRDRTANVVGFCCGRCGQTRAAALSAGGSGPGHGVA